MEKSQRNYGIDLLRIVSMLMIVALHVLGHGGILDTTMGLTLNCEVAWFLEIACFCSLNCYALISGYVAYNSKRKLRNFVYLWLQVVFFCLIINVIDLVVLSQTVGLGSLGLMDIVKRGLNIFAPILTNQYWYFTAYIGVVLCMPLLNAIINNTNRRTLKITLICLVVILFVGERILKTSTFGFRDGYSFPWLALMYVLGGYIAKYNVFDKFSIKKCFGYYGLCIGLTFLARILLELLVYLLKGTVVKNSFESLIIAYTTPTIVIGAIFLLVAFSKIKIGKVGTKIIGFLAPLSFGVYLIHTHPIVFGYMQNAFVTFGEQNVFAMLGLIIVAVVAVFSVCIVVDWLRKLLFDLLNIKKLAIWVETKLGVISDKIFKIKDDNLSDIDVAGGENKE